MKLKHYPFIHRDVSWLSFNERVLNQAAQSTNPLIERLKFLGISAYTLDEFFMIRMASLSRSILAQLKIIDKKEFTDLLSVRKQILKSVKKIIKKQNKIIDKLSNELQAEKIELILNIYQSELTYSLSKKIFKNKILPEITTPQIFEKNSLTELTSLQVAVICKNKVWFKIPKNLPTVFVESHNGQQYIFFLDHILAAHLASHYKIKGKPQMIRVTCDADVTVNIEQSSQRPSPDDHLYSKISKLLWEKEKGKPLRIEYLSEISKPLKKKCKKQLKIHSSQFFSASVSLYLADLRSIASLINIKNDNQHHIAYQNYKPFHLPVFNDSKLIFTKIKKNDVLMHNPYDSFDGYEKWLSSACEDEQVTQIQQTIYRTDVNSRITKMLIKAASHKKVRVAVELRARFDEGNNVKVVEALKKAGAEVLYHFNGYKLHAKVALITRQENNQLVHYAHFATGNYNAATAKIYTDLSLFTANQQLTNEAYKFFDSLAHYKVPSSFKHLLVAPLSLQKSILKLIDQEIKSAQNGKPARIIAKMNTLTDELVIKKLYQASSAGVKVDLIVRGACSLIPEIKNYSKNIKVISVVDRYLEHSRLYYFLNSKKMYIASADWMSRNFYSRIEVAVPILDSKIFDYLLQVVLAAYLKDNQKVRKLNDQAIWRLIKRKKNEPLFRAQDYFQQLAQNQYQGTPIA